MVAQAKPRFRRIAALVACSLPAVGFELPAPHGGGVILTYVSACEGTGVAPSVRTTLTAGPRWVTRTVMPCGPTAVTSWVSSHVLGLRKPSRAW
jgi:hypothetical protein